MTPRFLGLFFKKLQPKVGLGGYDIKAYFVVEAKSKNSSRVIKVTPGRLPTSNPTSIHVFKIGLEV